jgi:shikimate kinase
VELFNAIDPRLTPQLEAEWERRRVRAFEPLPRGVTVALVGHRAAGKTRLLPALGGLLGRVGVDLDAEIERKFNRPVRRWLEDDETGFRAAERAAVEGLPRGALVACVLAADELSRIVRDDVEPHRHDGEPPSTRAAILASAAVAA